MLTPSDFEIDETWVLFRLNAEPLRDSGKFDLVTLVDAASGKELWRELFPVAAKEASGSQARALLDHAIHINNKRLPKTLIVTKGALADFIRPEAERKGIRVKPVPEYELLALTSERREAFARKVAKEPRL